MAYMVTNICLLVPGNLRNGWIEFDGIFDILMFTFANLIWEYVQLTVKLNVL